MSIMIQPASKSSPADETPAEWFERFGAELEAVEARGGLLTTLAVDCEECEAEQEVPLDDPSWDDDATWELGPEPSFADELLEAVAPRRAQFHPDAADHAWELGYSLGRDGIAAASFHRTHAETMAFLAGHDRGLAVYQDDQRDEVEAVIAAWEADYGVEEYQFAESGSALGHMA